MCKNVFIINHKDDILYNIAWLIFSSIHPKSGCLQFLAGTDQIRLIHPHVRHVDFLLKIKSKLVILIPKSEPSADEEEGASAPPPSVSLVLLVLMSRCLIMESHQ